MIRSQNIIVVTKFIQMEIKCKYYLTIPKFFLFPLTLFLEKTNAIKLIKIIHYRSGVLSTSINYHRHRQE